MMMIRPLVKKISDGHNDKSTAKKKGREKTIMRWLTVLLGTKTRVREEERKKKKSGRTSDPIGNRSRGSCFKIFLFYYNAANARSVSDKSKKF